jgi:hypothetical protein
VVPTSDVAEIVHEEEWLGVHVGGEILLLNPMYRFVGFSSSQEIINSLTMHSTFGSSRAAPRVRE